MRATQIGRWVRRSSIAVGVATLVATVTALASPATQAHAAGPAPCTTRTLTQSLAGLGDTNHYFTVPGGTFEHGTTDWMLMGAMVAPGNEPWKVIPDNNTSALRFFAGGSASSPAMCVSTAEDSMRFFYNAPGEAMATLTVSVHVVSGYGYYTWDGTYSVVSGAKRGWALSPRIPLPDIRDGSGQQIVQITFSTQGSYYGNWLIDDVQIDPWRSL